jgi:hypothetical protein
VDYDIAGASGHSPHYRHWARNGQRLLCPTGLRWRHGEQKSSIPALCAFFSLISFSSFFSIDSQFYVMSSDFASAELFDAAVAFYLFPVFLFLLIQRRYVLQHGRAVHKKYVTTFRDILKLLTASFTAIDSPRVKCFTFSNYDEFFKVVICIVGYTLFVPGYVLWAVIISPLWAPALLLYAVYMLAYLFVLFLYTNCKLMGVQEMALLFYEYGANTPEAVAFDEESGRDEVLQELNALLNWLFFVELVFESLPQLIIASMNEVFLSKAMGNNDPGIVFYLQVGSSVLFFMNEIWPLINSIYIHGSVIDGIKSRVQFKPEDNNHASEIGIRAALVKPVAGRIAPISNLELTSTSIDMKKASQQKGTDKKKSATNIRAKNYVAPISSNDRGLEKRLDVLEKDNADFKNKIANLEKDSADLKQNIQNANEMLANRLGSGASTSKGVDI